MSLYSIMPACSKDAYRPSLQGIHIENGIAEVTDGYILVRTKVDTDEQMTKGAIINPTGIKAKSLVAIDDKETQIVDLKSNSKIVNPHIQGEFPKTEPIMDQAKANKSYTIGLGLATLEPLVAIMKRSGNVAVRFVFPDDTIRPIYVETLDGEIEMALMPVRLRDR